MKSILILCLLAGAAQAATLVQSQTFTTSRSYSGNMGGDSFPTKAVFSATINPFDPSLGTLQSFTVSWVLTGSVSGMGGASGTGVATLSVGGSASLNGSYFASVSGGATVPVTANQPFSSAVSMSTPLENTYTVPYPGTYNPALLAAVTGTAPVLFVWDGTYSMSYSNVAPVNYNTNAVAVVTYTYAPAAVPEASVLGLGVIGGLTLLRRRRA